MNNTAKFSINEKDFMDVSEIVKRIGYCLRNQVGFSLVRVGDAENQVMSQEVLYTEEELKEIWWADNEAWTGITLPNYEAREDLVQSIKEADVVGVLHQVEDYTWRPMTELLFDHYNIKPKQICYAFINIYFAESREFVNLLKTYKVLLIGNPAEKFARLMQSKFGVCPAGVIQIHHYDEIPAVLEETKQIDYDLALISAGSNANVLAALLAKEGKVALDFGRAMNPEYWKKDFSHPEKTVHSYNVGQPGVYNNFACKNTFHARTNVKGHLSHRFSNKGG